MPRVAACLLALLLVGVPASLALADDVPDDVRAVYEEAKEHFEAGELADAYKVICRGKLKNPLSTDYWELYVRIWRAMDKPEDVLWDKTIHRVEAKNPSSPVFDLLRARLAKDEAERIGYLKAAIRKAPSDVEPRILLARAYVKQGDDDKAEAVFDEILAKDPANEVALVAKGDLKIQSGFSRSAVDYAKATLGEHDLPGLHDLLARALLAVAENDESVLDQAEAEARKAVSGRADPPFVLTLVDVLDRRSKADEAVTVLTEQFRLSHAPRLAARLGEFAFRTGQYESAVAALQPSGGASPAVAKALAVACARLGRADEAKKALQKALRQDPKWHAAAAKLLLLVGDPAGAREEASKVDADAGRDRLVAETWAWQGKSDEVVKLVGEDAKSGSRSGEDALILVATARVLEKLGPKGAAAWQAVREGRQAAAKAGVPSATVPDAEPSVEATTWGFMQRYVTYRKCLDGHYFRVGGMQPLAGTTVDGTPALCTMVVGQSDCPRDAQRQFPFNAVKLAGNVTIHMGDDPAAWKQATDALTEGAGLFVAGADYGKAADAFGRVVGVEKHWGRMKVLEGVAKALGGDAAGGADLAAAAGPDLADDLEGRTLALLVQALAGRDVQALAKEIGERAESYAPRRFEEL